jgi:hypothetical protein
MSTLNARADTPSQKFSFSCPTKPGIYEFRYFAQWPVPIGKIVKSETFKVKKKVDFTTTQVKNKIVIQWEKTPLPKNTWIGFFNKDFLHRFNYYQFQHCNGKSEISFKLSGFDLKKFKLENYEFVMFK